MIFTSKTGLPPYHKIHGVKRALKSFVLMVLVLFGLFFIVASGGGGSTSSSTSSGTISGSAS